MSEILTNNSLCARKSRNIWKLSGRIKLYLRVLIIALCEVWGTSRNGELIAAEDLPQGLQLYSINEGKAYEVIQLFYKLI
jgi:hypothetical protein